MDPRYGSLNVYGAMKNIRENQAISSTPGRLYSDIFPKIIKKLANEVLEKCREDVLQYDPTLVYPGLIKQLKKSMEGKKDKS